jgi:hypothetical protein
MEERERARLMAQRQLCYRARIYDEHFRLHAQGDLAEATLADSERELEEAAIQYAEAVMAERAVIL